MGRFRELLSHFDDSHKHNGAANGAHGSSANPAIAVTGVNGDSSVPSRSTSRASSRVTSPGPGDREKDRHQTPQARFMVVGDTHEHHLRPCRRKEKLKGVFKEFLSRRKAAEEANADELDDEAADALVYENDKHARPPSLLNSLLEQMRATGSEDSTEALSKLLEASHLPGETFAERYGTCSEVVGKGTFGTVRLSQKIAMGDPSGKPRKLIYAVKEFKKNEEESEPDYMRRLTSEYCLSSSLHHVNVIESLDLIRDDSGQFCGVMEYCAGGDLYSLIVTFGKLDKLEADCFFKQMLRGVRYMHDMGVAHRDLKPENILLTSHGALKITDFGNAECFRMAWERDVHLSTEVCGSGPYIAPEVFGDKPYDPRQADSWSLGVIYLAMRTGRHLWHEAKPNDHFYSQYLTDRKEEEGYEVIESLESPRRRNVIYSILDPSPSRRLTPGQALKSEWGRSIKVCEAGEGHREHKYLSEKLSQQVHASSKSNLGASLASPAPQSLAPPSLSNSTSPMSSTQSLVSEAKFDTKLDTKLEVKGIASVSNAGIRNGSPQPTLQDVSS